LDPGLSTALSRLGAGALAWRQIRDTEFANTPAGEQLHEVYRRQRLSARVHERELVEVLTRFRAAGIEPILVKGWAIARRYPDCALRPYGDIDLCVAPAQFAEAQRVVVSFASVDGPFVDLHSGFDRIGVGKQLDLARFVRLWEPANPSARSAKINNARSAKIDNEWDELYARSQVVMLEDKSKVQRPKSKVEDPTCKVQHTKSQVETGFPVRVLSDEDHLRILCLHLLRSGVRRPAQLCDIALLIEQGPSSEFRVPGSELQGPSFEFRVSSSELRVLESDLIHRSTANVQSSSRVAEPETRNRKPETRDSKPETRDSKLGTQNSKLEAGFDWSVCLGHNPTHAAWVGVCIRLAHELLGADISQTPFATAAGKEPSADDRLPRWLVPAVRQQWAADNQSPKLRVQSSSTARRLRTLDFRLWTDLFARLDNPIRAVAAVGGNFSERSRLPYQVAELIARAPEAPDHLRKLWYERKRKPLNSTTKVPDPKLEATVSGETFAAAAMTSS
jgi:hypothetical protein